MNIDKLTLYQPIANVCKELEQEFDLIPKERKVQLLSIRNYISGKIAAAQVAKLIVICTHNSRRSHIGQLWLAIGADYFQLPNIQTFSGGTEATAFNIRAVEAFQRLGLKITTDNEPKTNPIYNIRWKEGMTSYQAFSKKYEATPNPTEQFAAIMVCSQADEGCPIVSGCDFRLSLPYDDPKNFDETDLETAKYDERCRQIGREMLWALSQIKVV